jgi:hypothetical protein
MTRKLVLTTAAFLGACALQAADGTGALVTESKQAYTAVKNNLIKAAEAMPEEGYVFKPTPDVRNYGALVAHIADANTRLCGTAMGENKTSNAASKTSKADLVAALKDGFAVCDSAWDSINDANALSMVKFRNADHTKLSVLLFNNTHDNEEYGYGAVYLRLKGVVPPSSAK